MSRRKSPQALELPLNDLPLREGTESGAAPGLFDEEGEEPLEDAGDLPLARRDRPPATIARDVETTDVEFSARGPADGQPLIGTDPAGSGPAPFRDRLLSGLLDLGIQLLVLCAAAAAVRAMEVRPSSADWPPFAVLGLIFSFLYWFIPLAFWGQTPGMAWVGNTAVSLNDEPLTFGQSVLRWLGALVTLALAGLPLFLAFSGRSLTDRMSDSKTVAPPS